MPDSEILSKLTRPFDNIEEREGTGGKMFKYVTATDVIKRLNEVFGIAWTFEVLDKEIVCSSGLKFKLEESVTTTPNEDGSHTSKSTRQEYDYTKPQTVIIRGKLTVQDENGIFWSKTQVGASDIKYLQSSPTTMVDFGNDEKAAISDCIKKCATLFGVGLDLYEDRKATKEQIALISKLLVDSGKVDSIDEVDTDGLALRSYAEAEKIIESLNH